MINIHVLKYHQKSLLRKKIQYLITADVHNQTENTFIQRINLFNKD